MDRVEEDLTPGEEWQQSLNATINRLSTQYVNLLRAASSTMALERGHQDPRGTSPVGDKKASFSYRLAYNNEPISVIRTPIAGGGRMQTPNDAPTPPLASSTNITALQCQLAVENLCVAASQLLSLIRTLRLSILLMDEETIATEEEWQVHQIQAISSKAQEEANLMEQEWLELRTKELEDLE